MKESLDKNIAGDANARLFLKMVWALKRSM